MVSSRVPHVAPAPWGDLEDAQRADDTTAAFITYKIPDSASTPELAPRSRI